MKLQDSQTGIGHILALVFIVVTVAVAGVGYIVYNHQQDRRGQVQNTTEQSAKTISNFEGCVAAGNPVMESYPEQCAANGQTFTNDTQKTNHQTDETTRWLLYESPGKEYSVRLADGWKLMRYREMSSFYTRDNDNLALKSGTQAQVEEFEGGGDGAAEGLYFKFLVNKHTSVRESSEKLPSLKTNDGLPVDVYKYTTEEREGLGGFVNGGSEYTYSIIGSEGKIASFTYDLPSGETDHRPTIEKVVKTFHFN